MEPEAFEKMYYEGVENRLKSIEEKLDKSLTKCDTECVDRFAPKEVATTVEEMKKFIYKCMGGMVAVQIVLVPLMFIAVNYFVNKK